MNIHLYIVISVFTYILTEEEVKKKLGILPKSIGYSIYLIIINVLKIFIYSIIKYINNL